MNKSHEYFITKLQTNIQIKKNKAIAYTRPIKNLTNTPERHLNRRNNIPLGPSCPDRARRRPIPHLLFDLWRARARDIPNRLTIGRNAEYISTGDREASRLDLPQTLYYHHSAQPYAAAAGSYRLYILVLSLTPREVERERERRAARSRVTFQINRAPFTERT